MDSNHVTKGDVSLITSRLSMTKTIVFVAALSGYCETLKSDPTVNALQNAIAQFGEVLNRNVNSKVILILNKLDVFKERLRRGISLRVCFGNEWTVNDLSERRNREIQCILRWWVITLEIKIEKLIPNVVMDAVFEYAWDPSVKFRYVCSMDSIVDRALTFIKRKFMDQSKGGVVVCETVSAIHLDDVKNLWKYCECRVFE